MTRANAVAFLGGAYAEQLAAAGLAATDTASTLGPVLDDALLALGTSYDDLATATVESADASDFRLLLRYFGLARILEAVRHRGTDVSSPDAGIKRSQYIATLRGDLAALATQVAARGYDVVPTGPTWQAPVSVSFDFLEPAADD